MNEKIQNQLAKLQEDPDFQFLYRMYKLYKTDSETVRLKVLKVSMTDHVKQKHKKVLFIKRYEYRAIWKWYGKSEFADNYHRYMSEKSEVLH